MTTSILLILLASFVIASGGVISLGFFARRGMTAPSGWLVGLFVILLLMPFGLLIPGFKWEVFAASEGSVSTGGASFLWLLPFVWLMGSVFLILKMAVDQRALTLWLRSARPMGDERLESLFLEVSQQTGVTGVQLKISDRLSSPVVAGLRCPVILLPSSYQDWSEDTLKMVFWHELGHVKRGDLWLSALSRVVCALYCFNPFVFVLRKAFLNQCEYACDAWVVGRGVSRELYLNALCDVASLSQKSSAADVGKGEQGTPSWMGRQAVMGMAGEVPLANRVKQVMRQGGKVRPVFLVLFLLCNFLAGFTLSSLRVVSAGELSFEKESGNGVSLEEVQLRLAANPFPLD